MMFHVKFTNNSSNSYVHCTILTCNLGRERRRKFKVAKQILKQAKYMTVNKNW